MYPNIIFKSGLAIKLIISLMAFATLNACTSIPEIKPDYIGLASVASATPAPAKYPSAATLPKVSVRHNRPTYLIGPHDELIINVRGWDDLGSQVPSASNANVRVTKVQDDGNITLPLINTVKVAGKTIDEVRRILKSRFDGEIEVDHVDAEINACYSKTVHVTGAVNAPGVYPLCVNQSTLGEALFAAQGLADDAYTSGGILKRNDKTYSLTYPLFDESFRDLDILLQPGDMIFFPRINEGLAPQVYVFGEVIRQGVYPINSNGMNLLDALGLAGGPKLSAKIDAVFLVREAPQASETTAYKLTLAELYQGPSIELAGGDRIFIPPTDLTRWNIWWRQVIPWTTVNTPNYDPINQ